MTIAGFVSPKWGDRTDPCLRTHVVTGLVPVLSVEEL